jgi:peptidoglycan/xylan/chitin deacetylase (PgdA/CDA1 family)
VAKVRLHLDADTSNKALQKALVARGHDVSRTPNDWMPLDAEDDIQLLGATAQGHAVLTFNIGDFVRLAAHYPEHRGIILADQRSWTLSSLIKALDRLLTETEADEWIGQTRWLNDWWP